MAKYYHQGYVLEYTVQKLKNGRKVFIAEIGGVLGRYSYKEKMLRDFHDYVRCEHFSEMVMEGY